MVYMFSDYKKDGVDMYNEFIANGTDDYETAVNALADAMRRQGLEVKHITVCPDAKSFEDLRRITEEGPQPGHVYLPYVFTPWWR